MGGNGSVLDRGETVTTSNQHKGLQNSAGMYHCFLNVVIQSLWHLKAFRERFAALEYSHSHHNKPSAAGGSGGSGSGSGGGVSSGPCVFCALNQVFTSYRFSEQHIIPPDALRKAMAQFGAGEAKFQLNQMADAEECLEEILKWLHCEAVGIRVSKRYNDVACATPCISHASFGIQTYDVKVCEKCGANSDLTEVSDVFMTRIYVSEALLTRGNNALASTLRQLYNRPYPCPSIKPTKPNKQTNTKPATAAAASAAAASSPRQHAKPQTVIVNTTLMTTGMTPAAGTGTGTAVPVPPECKGTSRIARCLIKSPSVMALTLVWNGDPDRDTINAMLAKLSHSFNLGDAYLADDHSKPKLDYTLRGMITFYGAHYTAFFRSDELDMWLLFNDSYVRQVGDWSQVLDRCSKGLLRPTVLFYENSYDFKSAGVLSPHALAKQMGAAKKLDLDQKQQQLQQQQLQHNKQPVTAAAATATHGHERKSSLPATPLPAASAGKQPEAKTAGTTTLHKPTASAPILPILTPPTSSATPSVAVVVPNRPTSPGLDPEQIAGGFAKRRDSIPDASALLLLNQPNRAGGNTTAGSGVGNTSSGADTANTTALPWRCLRCQREWSAAVYDLPCAMCDSASHILDPIQQPTPAVTAVVVVAAGRVTPPISAEPAAAGAGAVHWTCRSCGRSWQNALTICVMCDRDATPTQHHQQLMPSPAAATLKQ